MTVYRLRFNIADNVRGVSTEDAHEARTRALGVFDEVLRSRSSRLSQDVVEVVIDFRAEDHKAAIETTRRAVAVSGFAADAIRVDTLRK